MVKSALKGSTAAIAVATVIGFGGMPTAASSQSLTLPEPPVRSTVDENGVDLTSGNVSEVDVGPSVGDLKAGGLQHVRFKSGPGWRHGYMIAIDRVDNTTTVMIGGKALKFTSSGTTHTSAGGDGTTLVENSTGFVFTDRDGTKITFQKNQLDASYYSSVSAYATSIQSANGETLTLHYKTSSYNWSTWTDFTGTISIDVAVVRLQSVTSNSGYQLKYSYAANQTTNVYGGDPNSGNDDWYGITKVQAINNAGEYCDPAGDSCNLSQTWPTYLYSEAASGGNKLETITNPLGKQKQYTRNSSGAIIDLRDYGRSTSTRFRGQRVSRV